MENYLNLTNALKSCYEKYNYDQVLKLESKDLKFLCLSERKNVIDVIMSDKLTATLLVNERLRILHERENQKVKDRREYLDKIFV